MNGGTIRGLTVLYDGNCRFCQRCRYWLERQVPLLNLNYLAQSTAAARARFPRMLAGTPPNELVVVDDRGGVYRGDAAYIMCLYALDEYREWAMLLARPLVRSLARPCFEWLSGHRSLLSKFLFPTWRWDGWTSLRQAAGPERIESLGPAGRDV